MVKQNSQENLLSLKNISKGFPGVQALDDVSLDVDFGEVHVLIGENGAGKSTLIKIVSGAYEKDQGEIFLKGKLVKIRNPKEAMNLGISIIYQELNLVPHLSVTENIFLGEEISLFPGKLNWKKMNETAGELMASLGVHIDPKTKVSTLGVAHQQMVEFAKALHKKSDLIIMDEPTAMLSNKEIGQLFQIIRNLKQQNIGIIYVSHRLEELKEIGDRVTVLRDGKKIETIGIQDCTIDKMIELMVGRKINNIYPKRNVKIDKEVLKVENLSREGVLFQISFSANKGEILGIAGLVGAGRTEMARALFGVDKKDSGDIFIDGKKVNIRSPYDAIKNGLGLLTEDRKTQGLILNHSVKKNISLATLDRLVKNCRISKQKEKELAEAYIKSLKIKTPNMDQECGFLSGGNQQKVVLSRWLEVKPKVLIFDEPTRGIDVGAKVEIYEIMGKLAEEGICIIMISSDLPEVLGISDRVMVMSEGRIKGELSREEATQEKILFLASPAVNENE